MLSNLLSYLRSIEYFQGIIFINGFNLGRYWLVGPQLALYLPKELLSVGTNKITMLELERIPKNRILSFATKKILE